MYKVKQQKSCIYYFPRYDQKGFIRYNWLLSQVAVCLALASVAASLPQGAYKEVKEIPKPYAYQYAVADDYSKANYQKTESQDSNVSQPFSS